MHLPPDFSGVILVTRGDDTLLSHASGLAHRGHRVPISADTRFRVASIGKMFTAVAVLSLVQDGKLQLEDRVVELLDLQGTLVPRDVTLHHLLTMTAGIADWLEESGDIPAQWQALLRSHPIYLLRENRDYLPLFANKPPRFAVGERHAYNNASFILLGLAIERVTGRPYAELLRERVLEPAGMSRTGLWSVDEDVPELAEGYVPTGDGAFKRNLYDLTPCPAADGGATSTAPDLVRFLRALRGGSLLSPELTATFLQPRVPDPDDTPADGSRWHYGYGAFFLTSPAGAIVRWGHTGEEEGASGRLWYFPQQDVEVAVLSNHSGGSGEIMRRFHAWIVQSG